MEMESDSHDYECYGSKKPKNKEEENRNEDSSHSSAHEFLKKLDEDEINEIYKSFPSSPIREKKIETSPRLSNAPSETTQKHVTFDIESKHPRKKIDRQRLAKLYNNFSESELEDSSIDCTSPSGQNKSPNLGEQSTDQLRKMLSLRTQHMKAYREIARSKNQNSDELVGKGRGKMIANLKKQHEVNPVTEDFHSNDDSSSEQSNESVQFHDAIDHPIEFVSDLPKPRTDPQPQHATNERNPAELKNECDSKKERHLTESPQFHDSNQDFVDEPDLAEIDQIQNTVEEAASERHLAKIAQIQDSSGRHLPELVEIQHSNIKIASERHSTESSQVENICRDNANERHSPESDPISDLNKRHSPKSIVTQISMENSTGRLSPEPASTREWYKRHALEFVENQPSNMDLESERHSSKIAQIRDSNKRHSPESTQIQHYNEDTAIERPSFEFVKIQDLNARHSTETVEIQHSIKDVTNERHSSDSVDIQNLNEGTASERHLLESAEVEDSNKRHSTDSTYVQHPSEDIMSKRHLPESAQVLDANERHSPEYVGVEHCNEDITDERHSIESIEIQHLNENTTNKRHSSDSIHIQDSSEAIVSERRTTESAQVRNSNERHSTETVKIQHLNEGTTSERHSSDSTHIQHSTEDIMGERHSPEVPQVQDSNERQSTKTVIIQHSNRNNTNERHSSEIAQIQGSSERHSPDSIHIQDASDAIVGERHAPKSAQVQNSNERHSTETVEIQHSNEDVTNVRHSSDSTHIQHSTEDIVGERHSPEVPRGRDSNERQSTETVIIQHSNGNTTNERHSSEIAQIQDSNERHSPIYVEIKNSNEGTASERHSTESIQLRDSNQDTANGKQSIQIEDSVFVHELASVSTPDQQSCSKPNEDSANGNPTTNVQSADTADNIDLICVPVNVDNISSPPPNHDSTSFAQNPSSAPAIDVQTSQNNDPQGIPPQSPNQDANMGENPPTNTHHLNSSTNPNSHLPPHHQDANELDRTTPRNPIKFGWKAQNHVHWDDGNSSSNRSPYFNPNNSYRGRSRGSKFNQVKSGSYGRNDFKHSENQYRDRKHDTCGQSSYSRARRSDFHSKDRSSNNYRDNRCDDSAPSCQHKAMDIDTKKKSEPEYRDDDSKQNYSDDREKEFPSKHKYDLFEKTYRVRREDKLYDSFYHNIETNQLSSLPNFSDVDNPDHQERDNNPLPKDGKFKPYIPPEAYDNNYYPVERNERSDSSQKNDSEKGAETIDDVGRKHSVSDKDNRSDYRPHYSNRRSRQDDHKFHSSDSRARSTDKKNYHRGEYGHRHESRNEHSEFASQKYARNDSRRRDRKDSEGETRSKSRGHQGDGERRSYSKHRRYDNQTDVEVQSNKNVDFHPKPKYDNSHPQTNTYRTKAPECACDNDSVSEVESSSQHCPKCDCKLQNVRTEATPWTEKKPNLRPGRKQRERRRLLEAARNQPPNYQPHSSDGKPMLTVESLENQLRPPPGKVMRTVQAVENQSYRPPESAKIATSSENEYRQSHFRDKSRSRTPHSDRFHSGHDKTGCPYSKPFTPDGREKSFKSENVNKGRPAKYVPEKPKKIKKKDKKPYVSKPEYEPLITEIYGDLFTASEEYSLAHCVGQDFIMGAGIAVVFRKLFGRQEELLRQKKRVGEVAILPNGKRFIFYLITKTYSNSKPTMETMKAAIHSLKEWCINLGVNKLAIPRIGSGLDRLDWDNVKDVLYEEFRDTNIQIVVYVLPD